MARSTPTVVPLPQQPRRREPRLWATLRARAAMFARRSPVTRRRNPFEPAVPPDGVIGENRKPPALAMDAAAEWNKLALDDGYNGNITAGGGWIVGSGQGYYASAYSEGQEWLGYAVLALLSQRPEYRIMVGTTATEMTREWITFKSKSEDKSEGVRKRIEKLEERLKELKLRDVMQLANEWDGFEGRGQVYVDTGEPDNRDELKMPLDPSTDEGVKAILAKYGKTGKFIRRLGAIEPMWCYPAQYEASDPLKANWYKPDQWWVMGKEVSRHRLLTFVGNVVPDIIKPAYSFGGIATTQMAKPYVDFWLRNRTSESDLLNNFSMRVLATEMDVTTADEGNELFERAATLNTFADNQGVLLINKTSEEFDIKQTSLGGVPDITKQSMERMTIPSQMPIVKFFGNQPSGLNADSEGVIRMWYDTVKARQERVNRHVIHTIVQLCMVELFGEIIDDIVWDFVDLWQLDEAGKAAIQLTKAQIVETDIASGVIDPQEGRLARAKDEDSPYEGLNLEEGEAPGEVIEEEQEEGEGGEGSEGGPFKPQVQTSTSNRLAKSVEGQAAEFGGAASGGLKAADQAWDAIEEALIAQGRDGVSWDAQNNPGYPGSRIAPSSHQRPALAALDASWQEGQHPRDSDGKFSSGGGSHASISSGFEGMSGGSGGSAKATKPTVVAKKSQAAKGGVGHAGAWNILEDFGFKSKPGPDAVLVNEHGVEAYILPPDPGKKTSGKWQIGEKTGSGTVSLSQYLYHDLGIQPKTTQNIPKAVAIHAKSSKKDVSEALAQLGVVEDKTQPVAQAAALAAPTDPKAVTDAALKSAGWTSAESNTGTTLWSSPTGVLSAVEVFEDGSWYGGGKGGKDHLGYSASELVEKGVVSLADQPDAAFEAQHPRGPGGQFIAKLKTEYPWLGDVEHLSEMNEGGFSDTIAAPNNGNLHLNADDKFWQFSYPGKPVAEGGTDDGSLNAFLGKLDKAWKNDPSALTVLAKKTEASKPAVGEPVKLSDLKQVGPQLGSNAGGTYEAADGTKYYVKLPKTDDHAKNELLAASLYRLAGGSVLDYVPIEGDKLGIGTRLVTLEINNASALSPEQRKMAQRDFAIHAWLANWDAVGMSGDNIGTVGGKPVNLDLGGSLLYRAKGDPKGSKFDDAATEWKTLRSNVNPQAAKMFAGMTPGDLLESANRLKSIDSKDILDLVKEHGPGDENEKASLAVKLVKRRDAVLKQAEAEYKASAAEPVGPPKPQKYGLSASNANEADEIRKQVAAKMPPRSAAVTNAIDEYKGSGYIAMNDCMRYIDDCDDERVDVLKGYLDKAKLPAMTVYRGIRGEIAQKVANVLKIGRSISERGFSSCATHEPFSKSWAGTSGMLLEIRVPEGSLGAAVKRANQEDGEYEILLQRGSKYRVEEWDPYNRKAVVTLDHSHLTEGGASKVVE